MIFEHTSYRSYLKSVLADRIAKNPFYSLRAMARALEVQPSHLSAIHNGLKNLSPQTALKIAAKLGLSEQESEYFRLLVDYEAAKSPELKAAYQRKLQALNGKTEVRDLSLDAFKLIADWYHIPILEMTGLAKFKFTPAAVARRLGITPLEAQVAVERLLRLELIEPKDGGGYRKVHKNSLFKSEQVNLALRRFHQQMIERAGRSLETQKPDERYVGSQTFAIDPQSLPEAKKIIDEFRQKLVSHFDSGKSRTEVYHLGVQLFNLTKGESDK